MKQKSQPMRTCVGCGESKVKRELIRVALSPDGVISIDRTGKAPGRGAYLCSSVSCFEQAYKAKRLERSLKHSVSQEIYEQLRRDFQETE
ncbi:MULTISPECIES: RNase P modulator RnpM [Veillonella]|uniref:Protein of uncharacterized function (DUF448) n=2 Tax=Veillonella TaxID=29465 RepID=A0A239YWD9_9FIRM|nr:MULTISPECIES: YlxR family protein [Veillonella]ETS93717.1 PF04296 family protein [Veillonella sp. AS16]PQL18982.1 DUF448 domain-containing protein [Veillonella denticariosi JCM 15641]SNV63060.1 Protein of uncharacterised function (DUF448) [Veillonella rodentium]